ncbi:hypothetical protein IM40_11465 (plasmid) [Candidatus Paracaedimonas acanthamoebae]|nr:hypothetical protein IM40_11465 [Candidatus Paracaedimonas acanthamoebae]
MNPSQNKFEKLNQLIQRSLDSSSDPITKALEIARTFGAFKQSNVVFVHKQLYPINPYNPQLSLKQLKSLKLQKTA